MKKIDDEQEKFNYSKSIKQNREHYNKKNHSIEELENKSIELTGKINSLNVELCELNEDLTFQFTIFGVFVSAVVGYLISALLSYAFNQNSTSSTDLIISGVVGISVGVIIGFCLLPFLKKRASSSIKIKKLRDEIQECQIEQKIIEIKISRVSRNQGGRKMK